MKKVILATVVGILITVQISAFELWNGFTTEMGRDTVITRINSLKLGQIKESSYPIRFEIFAGGGNRTNINAQFPDMELIISCNSSLPQYGYSIYNTGGNINFYFYKEKLFAISISWKATLQDLLIKAKEQYMDNTDVISERSGYSGGIQWSRNWYIWKLPEKGLFISKDFFGDAGLMFVYDIKTATDYVVEKTKLEEQKRQAEDAENEAKRKAASDAVKF